MNQARLFLSRILAFLGGNFHLGGFVKGHCESCRDTVPGNREPKPAPREAQSCGDVPCEPRDGAPRPGDSPGTAVTQPSVTGLGHEAE